MKNKILLIAAAAVTLMTSCTKDAGEAEVIRVTTEPATESGKVTFNSSKGQLLWQSDDQISISNCTGYSKKSIYGIVSGAGTATAEFQKISGEELGTGPYAIVYPAAIHYWGNRVELPVGQHTPDGSLKEVPMYDLSNDMNDIDLHLYHLCGVVRFRLSASSTVCVSRIALATDRNTNGWGAVSGEGKTVSLSSLGGDNFTTLTCDVAQDISSPHDFYMYLPAGSYSTFRILIIADDGSTCSKSANRSIVVERGKITNITLSNLTFTAHRFSVGASSSVAFSPGNLITNKRFADRQFDCFGNEKDLFGSPTHNMFIPGWLPLLIDEWQYILDTRSASTINSTPNARYAKAQVANTNGLILFPDSYSHPTGIALPTGINSPSANFSVNNYNTLDWFAMEAAGCAFLPAAGNGTMQYVTTYYNAYTYESRWVFTYYGPGNGGTYWSSSRNPSNYILGGSISFSSNSISSGYYCNTDQDLLSIRLVKYQ